MSRRGCTRRSQVGQRGSVYLAVLAVAVLVATIGVGALAAVRAQGRAVDTQGDTRAARLYAIAATELGRYLIVKDPNWRTTYLNGGWPANVAIGNAAVDGRTAGTCTLQAVSPNGPLNNADTDPVILTGTGVKGRALQKVSVTLSANVIPLTCLNAAATAQSVLTISALADVEAVNQTIASNAAVTATLATVNANVESAGLISGASFNGTTTAGVPARTMPAGNALSYYIASGTAISAAALPGTLGTINLSQFLLSPANNPFTGTTNAKGIYVIDCQGKTITISNARIIGTLVLLNPGLASSVQGSVNWAPAVSNYPCLLVQGDFAIALQGDALAEDATHNYNPTGSPYPYPSGSTNTTNADIYPSILQGLVYISGSVATSNNATVNVLVAGGALTCTGKLNLKYDGNYFLNPPPGFYTVTMLVQPGSWKQVVN